MLCGLPSSCDKWGYSAVVLHARLTVAASLVVQHRLNGCGPQASLFPGMWDHPRSGVKPLSSALAGGFFTTEPPRKPCFKLFLNQKAVKD